MKKIRISNFLNNEYRKYAIYTCTSRGIPNTSDGLINGSRLALYYANETFEKTLSLVGKIMGSTFYHHGDASLAGTINKIAKKFQSAEPLLIGDGYFGSLTNHRAAACRYTSIKINPKIKSLLKEYSDFNIFNEDGAITDFATPVPIGLLVMNLGIAVGFCSKILPRRLEDMQNYLNGTKNDKLFPYFNEWNGTVEEVPDKKNCWLFKGALDYTDKSIIYKSIPPFMKLKSFLDKVIKVCENYNCTIENRCTDEIEYEIIFKDKKTFENARDELSSLNQMTFTENITFTDKSKVIEYESLEDYLNQYKNHILFLNYDKHCKMVSDNIEENRRNKIKIDFINMMAGIIKDENRIPTEKDITTYCKSISEDDFYLVDSIKLKNMTVEYSKKLEKSIEENLKENKNLVKIIQDEKITLKDKRDEFTSTRKIQNKEEVLDDFEFNLEEFEDEEIEEDSIF